MSRAREQPRRAPSHHGVTRMNDDPTLSRGCLRLAVRGVLLAAIAATPCWAQDAPAAAAAPPAAEPGAPAPTPLQSLEGQTVVTPEAQAVLDRMTSTLSGLQQFE